MFYDIKNKTEKSADLFIYGDIVSQKQADWYTGEVDETDVDLKDFKETVDSIDKDGELNIFINSGGGSVFAASTMISMLKRAKANGAKVNVTIDGLAASAASFFPMVADTVNYYRNSMLMVHKPLVGLMGYLNATEMKKIIDELDAIEDGVMMPLYEQNSPATHTELKHLVANESWLGAKEIGEWFPNFNLIDEEKNAAACVSECFKSYHNAPESLVNAEINDSTEEAEEVVEETNEAVQGETEATEEVVNECEIVNEPIDYSKFDDIIKNLKCEVKNDE